MKRCPECRRDYYDDTLLYCLDDGNALLEGPASANEPATAILSEFGVPSLGDSSSESPTRAQIHTTDQTVIFPRGAEAKPQGSLGEHSERQSLSAHRAVELQSKRNKLLAIFGVAVLLLVGAFFAYRYFKPAASGQINSLAVLPLVNQSGSADTDYLSDGLAESLIYRLSQLPNLKVSSASSVMRYKGQVFDVKKVAVELGVQAVLSGRFIQRGDNMSISIELIDAATNNTLWGEQYERKQSDLLTTQREIATTIAEKLQLKLVGADTKGITKRYTESNEAYQLYLKGRFNWNKRTAEGLNNAIESYRQAIDKDPGFALAYAGLADTYIIIGAYGSISPTEAMPQAKAAALKAIEIDNTLAEPHAALGAYYGSYAFDSESAEREYRRSTELNPNYATAWHWMGNFLPEIGKNDEAITAANRAEELDPLSAIISADTGFDMILLRRYDDAIEQAKHTFTIDPNFWYAHYILGVAYDLKGMHAEAIAELRKSVEINPFMVTKARLSAALAHAGQRAEGRSLVNDLAQNTGGGYTQGYYLAIAQLALGDKDAAFASLDRDLRERGIYMQWMRVNPEFDGLRDDPRFGELVRRMAEMKLQ